MEYNFTFKTDADLEQAQRAGFDDVFDIVRVSVKRPDGSTMDFPLKSEESFNNYIKNLSPQEEIEKIYQDKHGFEHGKLDYLNYLDENKKNMKNKMTLKDFQKYVISEATRLYKIEQLKEQKENIEKEISILSECVPPAQIGQDYLAGAPLMSPETLAKVRAEMLRKAAGWATPEPKQQLDEKKYSDAASDFIGKEISHLEKDKDYEHDRAVAAAINIAKDKGYKVPAKTNEGEEGSSPVWQMYFFKVKHDNGTAKLKTASTSEESAKKAIMNAEGCPENAITFVKAVPMNIK